MTFDLSVQILILSNGKLTLNTHVAYLSATIQIITPSTLILMTTKIYGARRLIIQLSPDLLYTNRSWSLFSLPCQNSML